jgi:hypothetical protein
VPSDALQRVRPHPKTARIVPISVAKWNTLKGGGDAITKLIDSCRERIPIRGEGTGACARILMYYAVVFHRFNGMLSCCKDLADYASIIHWRNAASHRYTFGESIDLFIDLILKQARIGTDNNDEDTIELPEINQPSGAFAPSPLGQVTAVDQSNDDKEVDMAKVMPFATIKSNTTPGQGKDVHLPDAWFAERAAACDGVYWAKRLKRPESGVSRPELAICHVCKRETSWYCFGCNRYLAIFPLSPSSVHREVSFFGAKKLLMDINS